MEERKLFSEYLRKNWGRQEFAPGDGVWEKLSSSLDQEQFDQTLRSGLEDFDAEPSPVVFDRVVRDLNEGRALGESFGAWKESLPLPGFEQLRAELNDEVFDNSILESYHEWNGGNSRDLWNKLDEELSREAVWMRLQHSLASYTSSSAAWRTMLSVAAMLLLFFHVSDESVRTLNVAHYSGSSGKGSVSVPASRSVQLASSSSPGAVSQNPVRIAVKRMAGQYLKSAGSEKMPDSAKLRSDERIPENSSAQSAGLAGTTENNSPELTAVYSLPGLAMHPEQNSLATRFPDKPETRTNNHFSVEFGPQLAVLTEKSESDLGTATPGVGFGGAINYRYHIGPILVSHGLNYSRYNQQCGDYVNGRYRTSNQQLNAVQFNTTAGVEWNRFHLYGGLVLSRALSGVEKSGTTVTKVYHFDPIAPGLTAGVNVKLLNFKKSSLGSGIQYSWVRGMNNRENSLTNVQGVRLNIVYSF